MKSLLNKLNQLTHN